MTLVNAMYLTGWISSPYRQEEVTRWGCNPTARLWRQARITMVNVMSPTGRRSARTRRSSCRNGSCDMFLSLCFMTLVRKAEKRRPIRGVFFCSGSRFRTKILKNKIKRVNQKYPKKRVRTLYFVSSSFQLPKKMVK